VPEHPIVVHKYGGSSLSTVDKLTLIAKRVVAAREQGQRLAVVVSAMGNTTDELMQLAQSIAPDPSARELDMLLSAGERISTAALAMAIEALGVPAVSLTGRQCRIRTTGDHTAAKIVGVDPARVRAELDADRIVVAAGFQGVDSNGEVTTLGRGGSDTTAVALAAALDAAHCDIYSDVDGVYSADPRVVDSARRLERLGYEEMQSLARHGARVLNADAVEYARRKDISIYARSTFGGDESTVIEAVDDLDRDSEFGVAGVTGRTDVLRLRYRGERQHMHRLREALGAVQVLAHRGDDVTVDALIPTTDIPCSKRFIAELAAEVSDDVDVSADVGSVAAVGLGVGEDPDASVYARRALERENVPMATWFMQPEALTYVVPRKQVDAAVRVMHRAFIDRPCRGSAA
jgi:aspartate kinase